MPPKPKGNYGIKRQRARKKTGPDTKSYTIPLVGPYAALEAAEPAIGSTFTGFPSDYRISEVTLEDTGGGSGKMLITIERPQPDPPTEDVPAALSDPIYESDYGEERCRLEEHTKCGHLIADRPRYQYPDRETSSANPGKTKAEAEADASNVYKQRTWDNYTALDAEDYDATGSGKWSLETYKSLRDAGFETFPVAFPICTATTYHRSRPASTGGINSVSTPPSQCSPPSGFVYVKSGDRLTKQGRLYTRVQSWRGYPPGTKADVFI